MTTVATDGRTMAGDGLAHDRGVITDTDAAKVQRLKDGSLFGCAGDWGDCLAVCAWLDGDGDKPVKPDSVSALHLRADGSLIYYGENLFPIPTSAPAAVGSGMAHALTAMDLGLDSHAAVKMAAKRDTLTGGDIIVISLEDRP